MAIRMVICFDCVAVLTPLDEEAFGEVDGEDESGEGVEMVLVTPTIVLVPVAVTPGVVTELKVGTPYLS